MPQATLDRLRAIFPQRQPVPDVRADRGVPLDLPRSGRGRPPPGLDRQGHPERRDPRRAAGRHARATRARRASSSTAARWSRSGYWNDPERTAERFRPVPGRDAGVARTRAGGVVRRRGRRRRGGLPLLRRPHRRDDQDVRLPGEPDRDRGGRPTTPAWSATRSRSASTDAAARAADRAGRHARRTARLDTDELLDRACASSCRCTWCRREIVVRAELPRSPNGKFDRNAAARGADGVSDADRDRRRSAPSTASCAVGGVPLDRLAARVGSTPFFAYDRAAAHRAGRAAARRAARAASS